MSATRLASAAALLCLISLVGVHRVGSLSQIPPATPADTFLVTDNALILFGRDVQPAFTDGRAGYHITKDDSTVRINGIVFFNAKTKPRPYPVDPKIQHDVTVIEAAAKLLESYRDDGADSVVVNGRVYRPGDTFALRVPQYDVAVDVKLYEGRQVEIAYDNQKVVFIEAPPHEPVNPVDVVYDGVIGNLHGARFVVMGRGYCYTFLVSQEAGVRASLSKISSLAEVKHVDPLGVKYYEPLTIDGYLWTNSIIRDVLDPRTK